MSQKKFAWVKYDYETETSALPVKVGEGRIHSDDWAVVKREITQLTDTIQWDDWQVPKLAAVGEYGIPKYIKRKTKSSDNLYFQYPYVEVYEYFVDE